jgi:hypothetical protein
MGFFLAAITVRLFSRVLGADDAPFRPVMGTRGGADAAAGTATTGVGSSSSGTTTVAASAAEPLRQGRERAGRGIAKGAQCREEGGEEHVNPLIGLTLPHAEQASLHYLEGRGLEVSEQEEQPIFRRRQGAVLVDGKLAGRPGLPIEAPRRHMRLERRLKGWDEGLKLVEGQAREIQELRGAWGGTACR